MENSIDYQEAIKQELQYIPQAYLASLYQIIALMAQPFKHGEGEATEKLSKGILQVYADKFRKGFSLMMRQELGLDFSFQIQEQFTILKLTFPLLEAQNDEIIPEEFDLDQICKTKQVEIIYSEEQQKYVLHNLQEAESEIQDKHSEKMLIFDTLTGIYLIETSQIDNWQAENASNDARNLAALMLLALDKRQKIHQTDYSL
ncbi:MAG: hypothetical protein NW226_12240 [Microscillaceae bacterium]|nr:hypothetical protein [Microscillaceae bacterium]